MLASYNIKSIFLVSHCLLPINDTHREKLQEEPNTRTLKNGLLAASDFCLHNQLIHNNNSVP